MWLLFLHDLRDTKPGSVKALFRSETREELQALVARETVAPYWELVDPSLGPAGLRWHKSFRKGGPLEWYDPPALEHDRGHYKHMQPVDDVVKQQVDAATKQIEAQIREHYATLVIGIPEVPK